MLGYGTQFWIMWGVLVQAAGVLVQCLLIYMGFNTMRQANELRNRQLAAQEKARDAQHKENMEAFAEAAKRDDKRHEESMAALRELIRQNHESEEQNAKRHEENMAALKTLIERTAPAA